MSSALLKANLGGPENTLSQKNHSLWVFPEEGGGVPEVQAVPSKCLVEAQLYLVAPLTCEKL